MKWDEMWLYLSTATGIISSARYIYSLKFSISQVSTLTHTHTSKHKIATNHHLRHGVFGRRVKMWQISLALDVGVTAQIIENFIAHRCINTFQKIVRKEVEPLKNFV
jgi:hypothetical protein